MFGRPDSTVRQQRIKRGEARLRRQCRKRLTVLNEFRRQEPPVGQHQSKAHDPCHGPDHQAGQQAEHLKW